MKLKLAKLEQPPPEKQTDDVPLPPGVPKNAVRLSSGKVNPTVVFQDPGDYWTGVLRQKRVIPITDKSTGEVKDRTLYDLDTDGLIVSIWGGTILEKRMAVIPMGHGVSIVYVGETGEKKRGRNRPKDFTVDHWPVSDRTPE